MSKLRDYNLQLMQGLGDTIYARPNVKALARRASQVFLHTSWPQLFNDLPNVVPVKPETELRTQAKNIDQFLGWKEADDSAKWIKLEYGPTQFQHPDSITRVFEQQLILHDDPLVLDLPERVADPPKLNTSRPIAVIRPPTLRKEWLNVARNPKPGYVELIAETLLNTHYVVSIADCTPGLEWLISPDPIPAHLHLHRGELTTMECLELCRQADLIVAGVGWSVPAGVALRVPTFTILGGQGEYNYPARLVDLRLNAHWMGWGVPENFCMCREREHWCDKEIPDLLDQFSRWRSSLEPII